MRFPQASNRIQPVKRVRISLEFIGRATNFANRFASASEKRGIERQKKQREEKINALRERDTSDKEETMKKREREKM